MTPLPSPLFNPKSIHMDVTKLTKEQKEVLWALKGLEGQKMRFSELEEMLDGIDVFEENDWFFTDEDYNDYDEGGAVESATDMIHSGDFIECPEPYIAPDGSEQHWNGDLLYEIWFDHEGDPCCHPSDDDMIYIGDVDIKVPDEYLKF